MVHFYELVVEQACATCSCSLGAAARHILNLSSKLRLDAVLVVKEGEQRIELSQFILMASTFKWRGTSGTGLKGSWMSRWRKSLLGHARLARVQELGVAHLRILILSLPLLCLLILLRRQQRIIKFYQIV